MKLDDIEKKNIFQVPEGYFEKLPFSIQSKVELKKRSSFRMPEFRLSVKLAFPILLVATTIFLYYKYSSNRSANSSAVLAEINTEILISYLQDSEITDDELIQSLDVSKFDFSSFDEATASSLNLNKIVLDKLRTEVENEYF